ncbi:PREDICTED: probable LRR receptor-like serine/threonine-protein kinase At2g16250 [Fragaria vesca subsp. vesca]|uniref:probable LRR receptor-like serine/threonine-protein kinase At2g16250 n=1 Tax=Fragaria vesca subsp. vesca TaxID=101020 RepID=UPI0002C31C90|nr:PREDICTED: probable LRR receptor-like serine/threonine-protein kinase At2g16250 [Fragaria vesca subsp. vesca]
MVDQRRIVLLLWVVLLFEPTFQQPSQQPLSSHADRVALLQLRSSLGLRSRDWPIKSDPCLVWRGVGCSNGRVVGINISGFRRTRLGSQNPQFSVDALANLTLLSSFNASNFLLPGSIPDLFGQSLGSLRVLDLTWCSVNGPIPSSLGNSTNLTSLSLSRNNLTGTIPASLSNLVSLSVLDLSQNRLTGSIPTSFGNLRNLSVLDISGNYLSGSLPSGIGNLLKLQSLNLSSNMLSSSIPPELGGLDSLVDLDLSSNLLLGPLPSGLKNLQRILVADNFLGGSLGVLWSMPQLSFIDVAGNNFTGLLPNSSSNANATAAVFNISRNSVYGAITPLVGKFGVVDLSGNYFQGKIPGYVGTNASLDSNCLQNLKNQRTLVECSSFYADRGLSFDNFGQPNSTQPPAAAPPGKKSNKKVIKLASVLGGVGLIVVVVLFLVILVLCSRKRGTTTQRGIGVGPVPAGSSPPPAGGPVNFSSVGDAFTYQQLLQATGDFNSTNLMKNGHTGDLFRGVLENGIPVVVKRIDLRSIKKDAYLLELDFFSKVTSTRFVPFLGHCLENENEKFMVYKYMPNGDLSSSLYKSTNTLDDTSLQSLDWITRLKIALGAAEGLTYLHHECDPPLVHRDVQASSILLDDKFEVRLGSLSDVCAQEGDTHHSRITRLLRLPQSSEQGASGSSTASCAYDVYCLGKVLLELVTGKLGISAASESQLKESLDDILPNISIYDKELLNKIVDPSLIVDEDLLEEVWAMAVVARSCLNPKPSRRPLMRYILKALENPVKVVREDSTGSARLKTASSRGSWNAAVFGSWRSSSEVVVIPGASGTKVEGASGLKHSATTGSQGSGQNGGGEHSSSRRRHSRDIFPEPSGVQDVERYDQD